MKVSIIVPVYNLPDLTKRALDSIPYDEDLEVIVVDDCSGKETKELLETYKDRIRLFTNKTNKGNGYSRSLAIDNAKGEYIIGLDNDDYFITDEFRKAMKELDGTDMVFINARINDGYVFRLNTDNKTHYCAFWTKFVRKELIGDIRPKHDNHKNDYFFTLKLMDKVHSEKYTGITAYHYNFPREGSVIWKVNHG